MRDGLYRVVWEGAQAGVICAGFVVEDGEVVRCAPILRKALYGFWVTRAERVGP